MESDPVNARDPIDIVLVVDTSASTGTVPPQVQAAVDANLRTVLEEEGLDYRIVLISECGFVLSGLPAERSFSFPLLTGSGDRFSFKVLLDHYSARQWPRMIAEHQAALSACVPAAERNGAGWQSTLRPGSRTVFMHFTDSVGEGRTIEGYAGTFGEELMRIDPERFGTPDDVRFTYHALIGLAGRTTGANPLYCPDEGAVTDVCAEAGLGPGPGPGYQGVAQRSQGYRAALCDFDRYPEVFQAVARRAVSEAQQCRFDLPAAPGGFEINLEAIQVRWEAEGGTVRDIRLVSGSDECDAAGFFVEGDGEDAQIVLCPEACDFARRGLCSTERVDPLGKIRVRFACDAEQLVI